MKMSVVRYPESMADLQIWDNAAFDNGESEDSSAMFFKSSWNHSNPVVLSSSESLNSFSSKENQNPLFENNRLPVKSQFNVLLPSKSIHQNRSLKSAVTAAAAVRTQSSVLKSRNEDSVKDNDIHNDDDDDDDDDDNKNAIDIEIEEIEKEIIRLNSRLDALRIEKAEKLVKTAEKGGGGRVIPAKFMEQKQGFKNGGEEKKKVEEEEDDVLTSMSSKSKLVRRRRGLSMGPSEIVGSGGRRAGNNGLSLGPAEIFAGTRTIGKKESVISTKTPIQTIQNRRKSCFWKLQEIDEEEMRKKKKSSSTVSPKSKKIMNNVKNQVSRQAATTIGSRKIAKREESILNSIQPKKLLFKDGEKSSSVLASAGTANKKKNPSLLRQGRIVPSRYNNHQGMNHQQGSATMRKRSLPENNNDQEEHDDCNGDDDEEERKRFDKKQSLYVGKTQLEEIKKFGRVKKRWEIPTEIPVVVLHGNSLSPPAPALAPLAPATTTTISDVPELLPSIKTTRCLIETPRDSGPAKRVAELVGRKSYFSIDEELEEEDPFISSSSSSVCQALNFADEDEELK